MLVIMVSLSENTRNDHPTRGMTLLIQAEISKKQTNFGVFATADAVRQMCMKRNSAARKSIAKPSYVHSISVMSQG
jgi:hypothetical protein